MSKKSKVSKTPTSATLTSAPAKEKVPAAVDKDGEATSDGAQIPEPAATPTDGDNTPPHSLV